MMTRRGFALSALALAGCQATDTGVATARMPTSTYDGEYEVIVSRLWNETAENLTSPFYQTEPDSLAIMRVRCSGGRCSITRLTNESVRGYNDFEAAFYAGGVLEMNTTVGYLVGAENTASHYLQLRVTIGERLLRGERVVIEPSTGYSANYRPHISIRRL